MPNLSVIVCTHNPREDYLRRTLDALCGQSLPSGQWELLLVDNGSREPLADAWDLSWHPHARHIREEELGLTPARLRGIRESCGEILVFVDDDNVLAPDYLENALAIAREWPQLGAWGGSATGEFDVPPPDWTRRYWCYLAIREVKEDRWSNNPGDWDALPSGAGLCIRRHVAQEYAVQVHANPLKKLLDRKGNSLSSCGDTDLAHTSLRFQLGFGVFCRLSLRHLMPETRLTEDYLVKLMRELDASTIVLKYLRDGKFHIPRVSWLERLSHARYLMNVSPRERRFFHAEQEARALAHKIILECEQNRPH